VRYFAKYCSAAEEVVTEALLPTRENLVQRFNLLRSGPEFGSNLKLWKVEKKTCPLQVVSYRSPKSLKTVYRSQNHKPEKMTFFT
jgi:hypothetical protein